MADNYDSIDFQHYELIPRDETLRPPIPDKHAHINTKPYSPIKQKQTQDNRTEDEKQLLEKQLHDKIANIQKLNGQIQKLENNLKAESQQNLKLNNFIEHLKSIVNLSSSTNEQLAQRLEQLIKKSEISTKSIQNNGKNQDQNKFQQQSSANLELQVKIKYSEQLLLKKQEQIRQLKAKLLQSAANNINAIFHTELSQGQAIFKQITTLKEDFNKIQFNAVKTLQCKHEQKIVGLIRSYDEMLKLYHQNQRSMHELRAQTELHFSYFSTLRSQLPYSIQQMCTNYTQQKLQYVQKQINQIVENIKNIPPQKVKTQQQKQKENNNKFKLMLEQIQELNEKLLQKQIQIQKMRDFNQELIKKSRAHQNCELKLSKMKDIQNKIKEKDKRISQLENTIIQQMDFNTSRADSINSQESDVQKQKNNIRNLKTIVKSLKQQLKKLNQTVELVQTQNIHLKKSLRLYSQYQSQTQNPQAPQQISSIPLVSSSPPNSPSQSYLNILQRVSKDQGSYRVIEDIVGVLMHAGDGEERKCKCLQLTTDCLLNLNEDYPELEDVLQGLGIIQKTTNLLPVN